MKTLFLFGVILATSHLALSSKKNANPLLLFSFQETNNCKGPGLQCKDCETIQYCSSTNLESLFQIRCEDQSRLRPFCDTKTNTCVENKPTECETKEHTFHCPGVGYYPDLEDCANYYICDENRNALKMACPTGENWVQGDLACQAGIYCRSYSAKLGQCKGKTNKLVAYSGDKNMYVLCLSQGPLLFQCPNKWEIFNEAEVTCKFECTENGYFAHPTEPSKFYSCTKVGKGYESTTLECPESYEFVQLAPGQGICSYKSTTTSTTTTTEVPTTIEIVTDHNEVTENNEAQPEDNEEQQQQQEEQPQENNEEPQQEKEHQGNNEEQQQENDEQQGEDQHQENNEEQEGNQEGGNNEEQEGNQEGSNNEEQNNAAEENQNEVDQNNHQGIRLNNDSSGEKSVESQASNENSVSV